MMKMVFFVYITGLETGAVRCSGQCLVPGNQLCTGLDHEAVVRTMKLLTAVTRRSADVD